MSLSEDRPVERIPITNIVPFTGGEQEATGEPPSDAPVSEPERVSEPAGGSGPRSTPAAPRLADLVAAGVRVAVGAVSVALSAASSAVSAIVPEPVPEPADEAAEDEFSPPSGPELVSLLAGAALGFALEVGRAVAGAADRANEAAKPLLSWVPVPSLARIPLEVADDRLTRLNERWRDEQSLVEDAAAAFVHELVPQIVDGVLGQIDITELVVERVDLDEVAAGIDIEKILARVDIDEIVDRVDLDRIIDRVDVDRVLARVDLNEVASRIDVDAVAARLDIDAVVDRIDIVAIARFVVDQIDLPEIIRDSSGTMATETVEGLRMQSMDADRLVSRVVDRMLRRKRQRETDAPGEVAAEQLLGSDPSGPSDPEASP